MDGTDANRDVVLIESMTRADELRNESIPRHNNQRGKATTSRSKTSVWTTLAISGIDKDNKALCALCAFKSATVEGSSSNFMTHYRAKHKSSVEAVLSSAFFTQKNAVLERAIARQRNTQTLMESFPAPFGTAQKSGTTTKRCRTRRCGRPAHLCKATSVGSIGCPGDGNVHTLLWLFREEQNGVCKVAPCCVR